MLSGLTDAVRCLVVCVTGWARPRAGLEGACGPGSVPSGRDRDSIGVPRQPKPTQSRPT